MLMLGYIIHPYFHPNIKLGTTKTHTTLLNTRGETSNKRGFNEKILT